MEVRKLVLSGNSLQKYAGCQPLSPGCIHGEAHDYKHRTFSRCVQQLSSNFIFSSEDGLDKMDYLWPFCNNFVKLEFPAIVMEGEERAAKERRISPCSKQCKRTTIIKKSKSAVAFSNSGYRFFQTVLILSLL